MKRNIVATNLMAFSGLLIGLMPVAGFTQNLLNGPQKIVVDAQRNRLLVSNANTGDLIQIDSAGNQSYFVREADFIDGIGIVGDIVFGVGSNRKIRAYNLATKQLVLDITLPGEPANYLSSITSDSAGCLFISCPFLNEIYRMKISDRSYWVFASNNGLNKPNGILLEKDKNRIVVIDDSPGSTIHAINLVDSTVSSLYSSSFYSPDGIIRDDSNNYYVGGYYLPGIYKIDSQFSKEAELFYQGTTMVYPTYDVRTHSILITHYDDNTWERVSVRD
jgi:DNA-binding beta-propeller fold protein YncE